MACQRLARMVQVLLLVKGADDVMQKLATDPQMFPEDASLKFHMQLKLYIWIFWGSRIY